MSMLVDGIFLHIYDIAYLRFPNGKQLQNIFIQKECFPNKICLVNIF